MRIVRVSHNRDFTNFQAVVNRCFSSMPSYFEGLFTEDKSYYWSPSVDLRENETEIVFTVDLPGFEKDEIDISLNNGALSISGERTFDEANRSEYRRVERGYGKFHRSFRLPGTVDAEKIEAHLNNGLLSIRLPRKKEALPRQIPVRVS